MGWGNPIVGAGGALVRPAIKSPNYAAGVSGWSINRDGSAEFADAVIRGLLLASAFQTATSGERIEINVDDSGAIEIYDASDDLVLLINSTGMTSFSTAGDFALGVGNGLINFRSGVSPVAQMFNDADNVYLNTQLTGGVAFDASAGALAAVQAGGTTLETRQVVGSGVGSAAAFNANWTTSTTFNGSTNWAPLTYRKDAQDNVVIMGAFKASSTTAPGAAVFQLPAGYRPLQQWPLLVQRRTGTNTVSMGFGAVSTAGNCNLMTQTGLGIAAGDEYLVTGMIPRGVLA